VAVVVEQFRVDHVLILDCICVCQVHKLFVYYTGYKTGDMRKSTPQWAFGEVLLDPNDPTRTILPNSWSFNGHSPWIKQKRNGKGGEWKLLTLYVISVRAQRQTEILFARLRLLIDTNTERRREISYGK
jgi:hypothetical protein